MLASGRRRILAASCDMKCQNNNDEGADYDGKPSEHRNKLLILMIRAA
jgi:hypothetical protein